MSEFFEELPRRIFIACLALVVVGGAFLYGALAFRNDLPPIPQLKVVRTTFDVLTTSLRLQHLQPSRGQGDQIHRLMG